MLTLLGAHVFTDTAQQMIVFLYRGLHGPTKLQ